MRYKTPSPSGVDIDMTPMIDMTFNLIAFFLVLLNFGDSEQDMSIRLPASQLAKPPDTATESPIVIQLTKKNTVLLGGEELPVTGLATPLARERAALQAQERTPADATVFIRADADSKTGTVQEVIQICQSQGFEKFALRARHEESRQLTQ